jgi:sirohydrochlorin ferrochelatase
VATTVLVAAGSTQPAARSELELAADRLAAQLGRPVPVLTMADDVAAELGSYPRPIEVATYLLAEGQFVTTLQQAAAGLATVAPPLGTHPRLVELVWARYDAR